MSKQTKIVIVNYCDMINAIGGVSKVISELANALSHKSYQVSIISFDSQRGEPAFKLNESVSFLPLGERKPIYCYPPVRDILCWNPSREIRHQKRGKLLLKWQAKLLNSARTLLSDADLIISSHVETTYMLREILKIPNPLITMFHLHPKKYTDRPIWGVLREGVEKSDALQVLLPSYIKELQSDISNRSIVCIPNYVIQTQKSCSLNYKKIICVARLSQEKCPELLIHAFATIKKQFPDWTVEWYGPKNSRPAYIRKIESLIKKEGLTNQFLLKGPSSDIPTHLMESSIFAFPSQYEGFPLALTEAMAHGLPSVGRLDCPAVNELIHDDINGFLVKNTPTAFAEALQKLMTDQELRLKMGQSAKILVQQYHPNKIWDTWDKLITNILQKSQKSHTMN